MICTLIFSTGSSESFAYDVHNSTLAGGKKEYQSVYMENQLDLQKTELENYETAMNQLADQLEYVMSEKEKLLSQKTDLEYEREALTKKVEELRQTINLHIGS